MELEVSSHVEMQLLFISEAQSLRFHPVRMTDFHILYVVPTLKCDFLTDGGRGEPQ